MAEPVHRTTARQSAVVRALPALAGRDPFDVTWRERVAVLGSLALVLAVAAVLGAVFAPEAALELVSLVPVSLFAVGKLLPLWGISGKSQFGPYELGLLIWILDTLSVIGLVYLLEAFYRIRRLERALARVQTNAGLVLAAYPRMRRAAVVGVVLFVLFPVAGTGALGATFLGIFLGLHRVVLIAAVSLGGCLGGFLMAFAAVHFGHAVRALQAMQTDPATKYLFLGAVALVLLGALWLGNRAFKRALAAAERDTAG